ncbi:Phosphatidylglycerol/phosphatidylinositol transfer protein [Taphrina deformans PYCC 5710]|uniref:Phosphatidylglycerol/phosphatidylinositol transfer protein n=1 Tax=Taphrina deformans (strain PYCC 5710 / ATCC 11124 / CBS 356.35 / IMI 108563 / JCM 9778 / NBRC 8474) TaxID=1097556 RepID=R4X6K6_TAPDE|nr:Phosphatidylglycerol/phosphatidylinositol transfer protein [Taphrina deformans PYCC 5710]|eukprot:CCG80784.1 Phosphatidylglycerol/phosphatidylinositol transfer protein [Taphrina deformans PYCC 5710]
MKFIKGALIFLPFLTNALRGQSSSTELRTYIPGDSPIDTCTSPAPDTDLIFIDSVSISPNPPERGQNLTITASGTVKEDILEGAYVEIDVKYGLIRLIHQTLDLCEQTEKVDLACPIKEGQVSLERVVELPQAIPPGKYTVNARVFTSDDREVTCLVARVAFGVK